MKKNVHLFSLALLLFTYLIVPVTGIAQTQGTINPSSIQSTAETSAISDEQTKEQATEDVVKASDASQSTPQTTETDKGSQLNFNEAQPRAPSVKAIGDDPGVTINAPDNIASNGQVVLDVNVNASAGNMAEDGEIKITIPKSIVSGDLTSQIQLPAPLYLDDPAYIDDGNGNYILNIKYNAEDIDQSAAVNFDFKIIFNAPRFTDHTNIPEDIDFNAELNINGNSVSTDSDSSKTIPETNGKPAFTKYTNAHSDGKGHFIMSPTDPATNQFIIVVNYDQQSYDNITISDTMPEGLSLADTNPIFPNVIGDQTPIQHLNIYKVTFDPNGNLATAEYVTQNFSNQISSDGKSFSLNLGKVSSTDQYAIAYGASVNDGYDYTNFGVEYNKASMSNNGQQIYNKEVPLIMTDNSPSATSLVKSVDDKNLTTTEGKLTYTLTLNNKQGSIKAGTIVSDPLPKDTTYIETKEHDGFSDVTYDQNTNTVSYTLLEDIPQGTSRTIQVVVDCSNPNFKVGDTIVNKAGFTANGTIIYSNDATTLIASSAVLTKVDSETNSPLAGAEFNVINDKGEVVVSHLVTNENGEIESGLLEPGHYSFVETKAPDGYVLDSTPNEFDVVSGQTASVQLSMKNMKQNFIEVSGTKTWDDNNNQDGLRPESINVNLLANGKVVATKKVTAEDNWKYSFTNLPKYEDGKEIVYTITEDSVPSYTTEINGFDITNHYTPEQTSVTVTKHWDDNNNQDGLRPDSIQVQLYANGEKMGDPINLSKDSKWTYTWKGLSKKVEGKDIVYTVKEITKVNGYETTIDDSNKGNIIITNKHNVTPKPDNNKPSHKEDTPKTEPSSSTHDALPETGENERMTVMSIGVGLILLMVALIASISRFKRIKNNK